MIVHLGMELALQQTGGDRAAARALIREGIIREAELEAKFAACSIKCRTNRHTGGPDGCYNTGSTCLCECHDANPDLTKGGQ